MPESRAPRIAVLRCARLPRFVDIEVPDFDALFAEDDQVIAAFRAAGCEAAAVAWDDAAVDWGRFDIALIRSTWDYLDDPDGFRRVLDAIEDSGCRLLNPRSTVLWNMDKRYLLELEAAGIPIVPTWSATALSADSPDASALRDHCRRASRDMVVLKPAIGLGAAYTHRVPLADLETTLAELAVSQPGRDYLAQPYIDAIASEGEWSFVYFGGQPSHVLLKTPGPGDYRVQAHWGGQIALAEPTSQDRARADALMAALPENRYARLDFVRIDGELSVMEAELIEPVLSFDLAPGGIPLLVEATLAAAR